MPRQASPSDLTDAQSAVLDPLLPPPKPGGCPRSVDLREVVNGLLSVLHTGCPWRRLPHDLPPWGTVWTSFRRWRDDSTLDRLHDQVHDQVRVAAGRHPQPRAVMLDSQSVKTTEQGARLRRWQERYRTHTPSCRRYPGTDPRSDRAPQASRIGMGRRCCWLR